MGYRYRVTRTYKSTFRLAAVCDECQCSQAWRHSEQHQCADAAARCGWRLANKPGRTYCPACRAAGKSGETFGVPADAPAS
jgi:hypothetical protein